MNCTYLESSLMYYFLLPKKGCTFLCIFGLPGDKQADESTNALDSAHKIHAFCSTSLMKVK